MGGNQESRGLYIEAPISVTFSHSGWYGWTNIQGGMGGNQKSRGLYIEAPISVTFSHSGWYGWTNIQGVMGSPCIGGGMGGSCDSLALCIRWNRSCFQKPTGLFYCGETCSSMVAEV
jgi:hypothetical protein